MMRKQKGNGQKGQRGQSFIELALVLSLLIFMLVGVVEFGYMLNQYITLVEGTREVARVASKGEPFVDPAAGDFRVRPDFLERIAILVDGGVVDTNQILGSIHPLALDPAIEDDLVISVFSFDGTAVKRFNENGESSDGWSRHNNRSSRFTNAEIAQKITITGYPGGAPNTGAILIEVYYHYNQILNLLQGWTGPIELHAFSIMPLSAAEPTP
ncbi:MAG TPA: hypothetical protein DCG54_04725 [Anaerolineae bacterium]|jgi:hypothetical protein|nr:hypothetical protein [Anaerolineae bacterium]